MPSSGARSGTKPSRSSRGAGTGEATKVIDLTCGHSTHDLDPIALFPSGRKLYACPECGGLQRAK